jgi:hypothetical protein
VAAEPAAAQPELSARDRNELRRLVRKYGRDAVVAAARAVPLPAKPGRPSRGRQPYFEAIHLAQWFEDAVAEHRRSRTPVRDAENELYELTVRPRKPGDEKAFESWRLNVKKKRLAGRRDLNEWREWLRGRKQLACFDSA